MLQYEIEITVYSTDPTEFVTNNGSRLRTEWDEETAAWHRENAARTAMVALTWTAHYIAREIY